MFRTYAGHSSAKESNKLFHKNLAKGQTGLSIAFDLPTQMGYDPDHELAFGEVGKVGVPVWNLEQMQKLMEGIPQDKINCSMTINASAAYIMATYIVAAEKNNIDKQKLTGTVQNDLVKEYLSRGTYIFAPTFSRKITADIIAYCTLEIPKWNPINICSYHLQEAGAETVDEIAFALANAIDILDYLKKREKMNQKEFEKIFSRISFFVNSGIRFITEICKMKAFKKLWQEIAIQRYCIKDPKLYRFRYGVQVNSLGLTAEQPENNVYRILLETLGVVLSKEARARAVQLPAWNEALGLPRPFDQQWSLRLQQIIAYETDLLEFEDIFKGSEVIEAKTLEIYEKVKEEMKYIDHIGGVINSIESGYMKEKLINAHRKKRYDIENGIQKVVGVNCFHNSEKSPLQNNDQEIIETVGQNLQHEKEIRDFREKRNQKIVKKALENLSDTIKNNRNIMPATIEAVNSGVTIGEWRQTLHKIYGEYRAPTGVSINIEQEKTDAANNIIRKIKNIEIYTRRKPKILIAKPGLDGHSNGAEQLAIRTRDCGFDVVYEGIRLTPADIAQSALEEGVHLVGISLLSGSHLTLTKEVIKNMKKVGIKDVPLIVGGIIPEQDQKKILQYGAKMVFTPKNYNIYQIIEDIVDMLEIHIKKILILS